MAGKSRCKRPEVTIVRNKQCNYNSRSAAHGKIRLVENPGKPALSRTSTRRKNVEAEKFPAISLANGIVAAEKCRATNSRNTFYFSRLDIFPPSGDPALDSFQNFLVSLPLQTCLWNRSDSNNNNKRKLEDLRHQSNQALRFQKRTWPKSPSGFYQNHPPLNAEKSSLPGSQQKTPTNKRYSLRSFGDQNNHDCFV